MKRRIAKKILKRAEAGYPYRDSLIFKALMVRDVASLHQLVFGPVVTYNYNRHKSFT